MRIDSVKLKEKLAQLNEGLSEQWCVKQHKLNKIFRFDRFTEAIGFISEVAVYAEKINHHPEWSNMYKIVEVWLITHSQSAITELDFELAQSMEEIYRNYHSKYGDD